jgi:uncharacterized protein (TIGR02147 family)
VKDARNILNETLNERAASRPSYSLRAFARDLGLSPQQLSNVMNGKRGLSPELAEKIAGKLDLSEYQRTVFIESLRSKFARSKAQKSLALAKLAKLEVQSETKNLEIDLFRAISNWHNFGLIELIKISGKTKPSMKWFSEKLGISENETALTFGRLERLGLISKNDFGTWIANQDVVIADQGIPAESIRNYHRQILEQATQALAFQTAEERYGSSSTLPVRVKNLARAKKLIQDFRLAFDKEISNEESGEEIYGLSIQFFRLTKKTKESLK